MRPNNTTNNVRIRRAENGDFATLSDIAFRSKAYWGYDDEFMAACRDDLTITAELANNQFVYVLEANGQPVGFYGLRLAGGEAELTNLFVEPAAIGHGYGKKLWKHLVAMAKLHNIARIIIESDPHAEPFYRAMGAVRIGGVASSVIPGRVLPLLRYIVDSFPNQETA